MTETTVTCYPLSVFQNKEDHMFDVHFHWFPKDLLELARKAYPHHHFLRLPFEKTEDSLRYMDSNGIQTALVDWGAHIDFLIDAGVMLCS